MSFPYELKDLPSLGLRFSLCWYASEAQVFSFASLCVVMEGIQFSCSVVSALDTRGQPGTH